MPLRMAILGLDPVQRDWLEAAAALAAAGDVEIVAIGDRSLAAAKDTAALIKALGHAGAAPADGLSAFDDLRQLLKRDPQIILMDRPANVTLDMLLACAAAEVAVFSLGPPVETLAEAQALAAALEPRTRLLYIWPRFADEPASRHCAQADDFVRPIRFASATWMGLNHALARTLMETRKGALAELPVRSLSVLAWDAFATLIRLMDVPTSVYAAIRGTVGSGNTFSDISGAASLTLRFPDDAAASITLCDRAPPVDTRARLEGGGFPGMPWNRRELLLWGAGGTIKLDALAYEFRDIEGQLIDAGDAQSANPAADSPALAALREFVRQYALPPSPHRGWEHRLEDVGATMEAFLVSHRTGQPESPERFRRLRR
jgi:predicted dehydrogenase